METDLLRSFRAVVRARSFTAAAAELGYVQSTVTAHVQTLEGLVGARLLDRLPAGAVPTEAGRRLVSYADDLLVLEERLRVDVPGQPGHLSGVVRLVAPESLCAYRLPDLIAVLRQQAPDVRLSLSAAGSRQALEAVRAGDVDLALLTETQLIAPDLAVRDLGEQELLVLAAADHPRSHRRCGWTDLVNDDVLLLEEGCGYSDDAARRLAAVGHPESRRSRFGSVETIKRCAAAGLGLTVLPRTTAQHELADGTLTVVVGPELSPTATLLVTHPNRALTLAAHLLLRLIDQQEGTGRLANNDGSPIDLCPS